MDLEYPDGATPLDPEEKEGLLLSHITIRDDLNIWEQRNITDALEWLENRRKREILTEAFIQELHKKMFGKVWKWAGSFRTSNKNIGVDWPKVPVSLRNLLDDVRYWINNEIYVHDNISARFHHRLVQIHLFPNGNGRHARVITDYLLEEKFNKKPFTWGSGNLNREGKIREEYIAALRAADNYNYDPLLKFVRS